MCTYPYPARELADKINDLLENLEGDFELSELRKAFRLVATEQQQKAELCDHGKEYGKCVVLGCGHCYETRRR